MNKEVLLIGFDIGGTKIAVCLGDSNGKMYSNARIDNVNTLPEETVPKMISEAKRLVAEAGFTMDQIAALGISCPGAADYAQGIMTRPSNNKHWHNVPIKRLLEEGLGVVGYFENDANSAMLAEWFFGAAKGAKNAIYLTMSTGIGAGIVVAGHLVSGANGLGGEVGHMVLVPNGVKCNCGMTGCYETYCGGRGFAQRVQTDIANGVETAILEFAGNDINNVDMIAIEKGVRANDPYAVRMWEETMELNAQGIGILINSLNPEKVVLGTFAWAIGELFMQPLMEKLPKYTWKEIFSACEVVPSDLRRDIGNYAGVAAAMNGLYEAGKISL